MQQNNAQLLQVLRKMAQDLERMEHEHANCSGVKAQLSSLKFEYVQLDEQYSQAQQLIQELNDAEQAVEDARNSKLVLETLQEQYA